MIAFKYLLAPAAASVKLADEKICNFLQLLEPLVHWGNVHRGDVPSVQREDVHGLDVHGEDIQCGNVQQCAAMYTGVMCSMCRERGYSLRQCARLCLLTCLALALHCISSLRALTPKPKASLPKYYDGNIFTDLRVCYDDQWKRCSAQLKTRMQNCPHIVFLVTDLKLNSDQWKTILSGNPSFNGNLISASLKQLLSASQRLIWKLFSAHSSFNSTV